MSVRIAHISDLHFGASRQRESVAKRVVEALLELNVDFIACTGDMTEAGRALETWSFRDTFRPLLQRMVLVPGNHDRQTSDYASQISDGRLVWREDRDEVSFICIDTSFELNANKYAAHGTLSMETIRDVGRHLDMVPSWSLPVILCHHHPLKLPPDDLADYVSSKLKFPYSEALDNGRQLIAAVAHRRPLILHGHRHRPGQLAAKSGNNIVMLYNAGSTTDLEKFRVFEVDKSVVRGIEWYAA